MLSSRSRFAVLRGVARRRTSAFAALAVVAAACQAFDDEGAEPSQRTSPVVARSPMTFYVDAVRGSDVASGTQAAPSTTGGPWRTLARVTREDLQPGDTVLLAGGQTWYEPLVIDDSGTAELPIRVGRITSGSARPRIVPTVALPAWTPVAGLVGVYVTTVNGTVTQLASGGGLVEVARYPVRASSTDPVFAPSTSVRVIGTGITEDTAGIGIDGLPVGITAAELVGTSVALRDSSFTIRQFAIGSATVSGTAATVDFAVAGGYGARAGAGYYLMNRLWMLRHGRGWVQDGNRLYVRLSGDVAPPVDGSLRATMGGAIGVDARNTAHVRIEQLDVADAWVGVAMSSAEHLTLAGLSISRSADRGIAARTTRNSTIDGVTVSRTAHTGIEGSGSTGLVVANSIVQDAGTLGTPQPGDSGKGIICSNCNALSIHDNIVRRTAYSGILSSPPSPTVAAATDSVVEHNLIEDTCQVLDDCGAFYTTGRYDGSRNLTYNPTFFRNNLIIRGTGNADGRVGGGAAQGIYYDDMANGGGASGNIVYDVDSAIQLHAGFNTFFRNNVLVAPRARGLWMQENDFGDPRPCPDFRNCMHDNVVENNWFIPSRPTPSILLNSAFDGTEDFGKFRGNHYLTELTSLLSIVAQTGGSFAFAAPSWGSADGFPYGRGAALEAPTPRLHGGAPRAAIPATTDAVALHEFAADGSGVSRWPATSSLTWGAAEGRSGGGLRFAAPATGSGLLIAGNFPVSEGDRYLVSFDLRADAACERCGLGAVIRAWGTYENLTRVRALSATTEWRTVRIELPAAVAAASARLDLNVPQGVVVHVDNLRVERIAASSNRIVNGHFVDGTQSWRGWPARPFSTTPDGSGGLALRVVATDASILVSSQGLAVTQRQRYLVRFDARASAATSLNTVLREEGPSYRLLAQAMNANVGPTWQTFAFTIDTTRTVNPARLDFYVPAATTVDLDNVVLVPLSAPAPLTTRAFDVTRAAVPADPAELQVYYNPSSARRAVACPSAAMCGEFSRVYVEGANGGAVTWPLSVAPWSAVVVRRNADSDGDGVRDVDDWCERSAAGAPTDEVGCTYAQLH